jgi:hypothetical protein
MAWLEVVLKPRGNNEGDRSVGSGEVDEKSGQALFQSCGATKVGGHGRGGIIISFSGDKCAFVKFYGVASGTREIIQNSFKIGRMLRNSTNNDEDIICVLKNGAGWEIIDKRVKKQPISRRLQEHLL